MIIENTSPSPGKPALFFSHYGLRSGWRALLFVLIFLAIAVPAMIPARRFMHRAGHTAEILVVVEAVSAGCILVATWLAARFIERKPLTAFGLSTAGAGRKVAIGMLAGFFSLSLLIGALDLFGYEQIGGLAIHGVDIWRYAALWSAVFILVAVNEELTTRGYLLFTLSQAMGFWPSAILLSALFGLGHLGNSGEQWIGIVAAALIGVILAWTVRWTGSLWWAMGFHAAWDWAETFFYGVPDSGTVAEGHLLTSSAHGLRWLSGGSTGPEGSLFVFPVIILLAVFVWRAFPYTPPEGLARLR